MDTKPRSIELEEVSIRFSGDSGDGMQLTGTLFSNTAALFGNDLSTFPDYPSEIRAPQGTVGGVSGELLIIGWGSTYGHLLTAFRELEAEGKKISLAHFRYIRPLPKNTREVLSRFKKIVVCELNLGQFANYLRMNFQEFEFKQYNKIQGLPFTVIELKECFIKILKEK